MRPSVAIVVITVLVAGCSRSTAPEPPAVDFDACDLIAGVLVGIVERQLDALEEVSLDDLTGPSLPPELAEATLDADELAVQARAFDCDQGMLRGEVTDALESAELESTLAEVYLDILLAELASG